MSAADPGMQAEHAHRLFECGLVVAGAPAGTPVDVRRGMSIVGCDRAPMGRVAAVVVDAGAQRVTGLLLACGPSGLEYRLVPVSLIARVGESVVLLQLPGEGLTSLPYHAGQDTPDHTRAGERGP